MAGYEAHSDHSWHMLTPEMTAIVRMHEDRYTHPYASDKSWCCNHCAAHFQNPVNRGEVLKHVQRRYEILLLV